MAKKTTNTKSGTKKVNKINEETKTKAVTSELIGSEPECVAATPIFIEEETSDNVKAIIHDIKEKEEVLNFVSCEPLSENITTIDTNADSICMPHEWSSLKNNSDGKNMYETNNIDEMNIKELVVYKDAIDKLITHHSNLCEMNRGFDDKIYNESLTILNRLHGYLSRVNNTIKNKIFSLE